MKRLSPARRLHRVGLFSAMSLALCLHCALVRAADPLPVPTPPGPGININNPAAIAKAEGIQHPFQHSDVCTSTAATCEQSFTLSANRRLVIEYVSVICSIPANVALQVAAVRTTLSGTEVTHVLNHTDRPPAATTHAGIAAHVVKLYADAATTIRFIAAVDATNVAEWTCNLSLSGQTVDVP
jgi:hypothetical protein